MQAPSVEHRNTAPSAPLNRTRRCLDPVFHRTRLTRAAGARTRGQPHVRRRVRSPPRSSRGPRPPAHSCLRRRPASRSSRPHHHRTWKRRARRQPLRRSRGTADRPNAGRRGRGSGRRAGPSGGCGVRQRACDLRRGNASNEEPFVSGQRSAEVRGPVGDVLEPEPECDRTSKRAGDTQA